MQIYFSKVLNFVPELRLARRDVDKGNCSIE